MIDAVTIFTKGGLILWSLDLIPVDHSIIDGFIKECLVEKRNADLKYKYKDYEFRWLAVNRLSAFILVVFKGILETGYIDTMLGLLRSKLISKVGDNVSELSPMNLSADFTKILEKCDKYNTRTPVPPARSTANPRVAGPSVLNHKKSDKKSKDERAWGISGKAATSKMLESLDFSNPSNPGTPAQADYFGDSDGDSKDELIEDMEVTEKTGGLIGRLVLGIKNVTGNAQLTRSDLAPILSKFQQDLMTKNVARDVAVKIVDGVGETLVGTRTERFTSIGKTVCEAITSSIEAILTPKKSIDIMKAVMDTKARGEVYSVVFLGVNGVGKSTNLAKVAYYLKNKGGFKVLIAACDTFRSGAVEQLKVHANCLNIDLFERGYGKDSAEIAKQAIAHAKSGGYDVCLIDTAGRMQDNEPLMRAIAKLVAMNKPNLILFVGEALVGHDAVDQLVKFNRALVDYATGEPRTIDGMILTKYDTVDDKVGAALSMVFITGQPIVFVGTGQKYPHLRKLQVAEVVKSLMS